LARSKPCDDIPKREAPVPEVWESAPGMTPPGEPCRARTSNGPGDLEVVLLDARLVARWDAFSDRCTAEWPRRNGLENRRRHWSALSRIPDRRPTARSHPNMGCVLWTADTSSNATTTSICAGQSRCGAPRRNRTGDPILTMEPPGTAVRTAVSPGHARPYRPKLSVLLRRSYAFTYQLIGIGLQAGLLRIGRPPLQCPART
jgi:hypothetical protein